MADPERGLWGRTNFKEAPQFLKSNQISPVYGLTSNKDQTFVSKSYFDLFLYREIRQFCVILGHFGGACPRLSHLDPPLNILAPRPRLIGICL